MTLQPLALAVIAPLALCALQASPCHAQNADTPALRDTRIRDVSYDAERVYRLTGRLGYQLSIEFAPDEHFVGLASGDTEALSFEARDNRLFLKPKATHVATNLTVLTDRRHYYFDYLVADDTSSFEPALYVLRFSYPQARPPDPTTPTPAQRAAQALTAPRPVLNTRYFYCGAKSIKPLAVTDDGVRTRFVFAAASELPAIFMRASDGTEQLANFTVTGEAVLVHRLAPGFILRRGRDVACVVNRGFDGAGQALPGGTITPAVRRDLPRQPDTLP